MPGAVAEVEIEGLAKLQRTFHIVGGAIDKNLHLQLVALATPVKTTAEGLALQNISGLRRQMWRKGVQPRWSRMRIGVTRKLVYVAPKEHGHRGGHKMPAFGQYLLDEAMDPALEAHKYQIRRDAEKLVLGTLKSFQLM